MKTTCPFVTLALATLVTAFPVAAQVPQIFEPRFEGQPLWISAEALVDPEKIIDADRIPSVALRMDIEKQRESLKGRDKRSLTEDASSRVELIPASECKNSVLTSAHRGGEDPSATLSDLTTYSQAIFIGTIRSIEVGFSWSEPSSLLRVQVSRVVKGSVPQNPLYVDYPIARFKLGPFTFCNGNKGFEPHPGDEILLFDYTGPEGRDDVLYFPRFDQIFFQPQEGLPILPPHFKTAPELKGARTLSEVIDRLRSRGLLDSRRGAQ
jgi:hypothetical protein